MTSQQTSADYAIGLYDQFGAPLKPIVDFHSIKYTRVVNGVGTLSVTLPRTFDFSLINLDNRVVVVRKNQGQSWYVDTDIWWLIRHYEWVLDQSGEEVLLITAHSPTEILKRRIVAYNSGTSQAEKTDLADDMMKEIVDENFVSATDTNRNISSYLQVQGNASLGPTVTHAFSRKNVLQVLQDLSQMATTAGTPVFFDVVSAGPALYEFRTYINQRGIDHTSPGGNPPVVLAPELGNFTTVKSGYNFADEYNYVYAAGQGQKSERQVETASNLERINWSPINRREKMADSRQVSASSSNLLQARADASLREGRPERIFSGEFVNAPGSLYGVNWRWGDKVTAAYRGQVVDCFVDAVTVEVKGGKETITPTLRVVED